MAITNGYATLLELLTELGIDDSADNAALEECIEAASRFIDQHTGREFYTTTEARYFTADDSDLLYIDDATAVTTVATDSANDRTYATTWAGTDWELGDGPPYNELWITPNGDYTFPTSRRSIKVTADWGYSATTPPAINRAALLLASRLFKRRDAILGVAGATVGGVQVLQTKIHADSDLIAMLDAYKRVTWRR